MQKHAEMEDRLADSASALCEYLAPGERCVSILGVFCLCWQPGRPHGLNPLRVAHKRLHQERENLLLEVVIVRRAPCQLLTGKERCRASGCRGAGVQAARARSDTWRRGVAATRTTSYEEHADTGKPHLKQQPVTPHPLIG